MATIKPVVTIGASMSDITIGRLSDATGVKVETIRYYEKIGIMPNPPRTSGGQRIYSAEHRARLGFVKRSRDLGFSLESVRSLLGLSDEPPSCGEVHAITMTHLQDVRHKIDDLKRLEKMLSAIASECAGGETPNCPIIDALAA
jgi:MerR family mercuric resistance operon transcriptional regulator